MEKRVNIIKNMKCEFEKVYSQTHTITPFHLPTSKPPFTFSVPFAISH